MAWTTPKTWIAGELVDETEMNTYVTDNTQYLYDNLGKGLSTLTNGSGGSRVANDLVVWNTASDTEFTTSTEQADRKIAGVVVETIANGADGLVQNTGRVTVATTGVVARGDGLRQSTTAATAEACAYGADGCFAVALTASAGGTSTVECLLLLRAEHLIACRAKRTTQLINVPGGPFTFTIIDADDYDTDAMHNPGGANPERVTVPIAGIYHVDGYIQVVATGTTSMVAYLYQNAAIVSSDDGAVVYNNGGRSVTGDFLCAAGDYFAMTYAYAAGGSRGMIGYLTVRYVGAVS